MIPSIVTSTAVVGGLMCLELYKLIQGKPFTHHKHAYFNLAVPLFAFAQPIKAFEHTVKKFLYTYFYCTSLYEFDHSSIVACYFICEYSGVNFESAGGKEPVGSFGLDIMG